MMVETAIQDSITSGVKAITPQMGTIGLADLSHEVSKLVVSDTGFKSNICISPAAQKMQ